MKFLERQASEDETTGHPEGHKNSKIFKKIENWWIFM